MSTMASTRDSKGNRRSTRAEARGVGAVDYPLIIIIAIMVAMGLVMVYSASFVQVGERFVLSQLLWIALGIVAMIIMANIPYRRWQQFAIPIMVLALILLVAVLIVGDELNGAQRTLFHGRVQPSEAAKIAVVIYVAAWVSARGKDLAKVETGLIPFAILMGVVTALLVLEPSFSVSIIILAIGTAIFFMGGGDIKQLLIVGAIGSIVMLLMLWQSGYGFERIQTWWRTLSDPGNADYNIAQSMRMLRRGFSFGIGSDPGEWLAKNNLPLLWSDYLFVNIGHDLGFPGALAVVGLLAAVGYRGLGIALNAPDPFGGLTAIGITTWYLTQAVIHIGTSLALIPATGQPLPFMSYGGSAMLSCMAAAGILLNISRAAEEKKSTYATFAFGWGNGRPRVSDSDRSERTAKTKGTRRKSTKRTFSQATSGNKRQSNVKRKGSVGQGAKSKANVGQTRVSSSSSGNARRRRTKSR